LDRPLPAIDDINRDYWEGARNHRLVVYRCGDCRYWIHPPLEACPKCQSERVAGEEVSGKGAVYSWSVMHTKGNPGFDHKLPYATVIVELAEQEHLFTIGNIDCDPKDIEIGMPLEVTFEKLTDEVTLPQWRPTTGGAR